MIEIRNLDNKRVCDLSADKKTIIISRKNCQTVISIAVNGTLEIQHKRLVSST